MKLKRQFHFIPATNMRKMIQELQLLTILTLLCLWLQHFLTLQKNSAFFFSSCVHVVSRTNEKVNSNFNSNVCCTRKNYIEVLIF